MHWRDSGGASQNRLKRPCKPAETPGAIGRRGKATAAKERIMKFYHNRTRKGRSMAQFIFEKAEVDHLGGTGTHVGVVNMGDQRWLLKPDSAARSTIHLGKDGKPKVTITNLDMPFTMRTTLAHVLSGSGGIMLKPFESDLIAPPSNLDVKARLVAKSQEPPSQPWTRADLKTAIALVRDIAIALEAELFIDEQGELHAKISQII
jgi:hypothetical protein